jgi:hypothetical protein
MHIRGRERRIEKQSSAYGSIHHQQHLSIEKGTAFSGNVINALKQLEKHIVKLSTLTVK